jgi:fructose-specific phosphotransferase system component IIB
VEQVAQAKEMISQLKNEAAFSTINPLKTTFSQIQASHHEIKACQAISKMILATLAYLESKKETAHPDTVDALDRLTDQLNKTVSDQDMTLEELGTIAGDALGIFNQLKLKIAAASPITQDQLDELKAVILAIDWEITDTTIKNFDTVVSRMVSSAGSSKMVQSYLKMILNLGRYIGSRKADAHTESITFLQSVYDRFEAFCLTEYLSVDERRRFIKQDIEAFRRFKAKLSSPLTDSGTSPHPQSLLTEREVQEDDEGLSPALSHVGSSAANDGKQFSPLVELPDESDASDEMDSIVPALSDKAPPRQGNRDVMGDLFSLKDSPADELLDAIHLMDVHGSGPDQAARMLDQVENQGTDGVKNITPQRMDNEPIQEIGERLDEFFSLETASLSQEPLDDNSSPEDDPVPPADITDLLEDTLPASSTSQTDETMPMIEPESDDDGIVPFDFDSDDKDSPDFGTPGDQPDMDQITQTIFNRINKHVESELHG